MGEVRMEPMPATSARAKGRRRDCRPEAWSKRADSARNPQDRCLSGPGSGWITRCKGGICQNHGDAPRCAENSWGNCEVKNSLKKSLAARVVVPRGSLCRRRREAHPAESPAGLPRCRSDGQVTPRMIADPPDATSSGIFNGLSWKAISERQVRCNHGLAVPPKPS